MLVHHRVTPSIKFANTHLNTGGERFWETKASCPRTQHNVPGSIRRRAHLQRGLCASTIKLLCYSQTIEKCKHSKNATLQYLDSSSCLCSTWILSDTHIWSFPQYWHIPAGNHDCGRCTRQDLNVRENLNKYTLLNVVYRQRRWFLRVERHFAIQDTITFIYKSGFSDFLYGVFKEYLSVSPFSTYLSLTSFPSSEINICKTSKC